MFEKPIATPCGKCLYCRQQKASEWTKRLSLEYLNYEHNSFVTLTYKEDSDYESEIFKHSRELHYKDIQLFMKRLRKQLYTKFGKYEIKFFAAGEYGTQFTKRAHWHLIIFNLEMTDEINEIIKKCWNNGICDNKKIESVDGVAKYVSSYVLDKIDMNPDEYREKEKRKPPFHRGSQKLGLTQALNLYLESARESWNKFKDLKHIVYKGEPVRLCRYLRNKIADNLGILQEVKEKGIEEMQKYINETIEIYKKLNTGEIKERFNLKTIFNNPLSSKIIKIRSNNEWYANYVKQRQLYNEHDTLLLTQAWEFRHRPKFKAMKAKFETYKLEKQLKRAI